MKRKRRIAPRLASGESRESIGHGLPPNIKQAIRMKAAAQGRSLSWMLEQLITESFGLRVQYVEQKEHLIEEPRRRRR